LQAKRGLPNPLKLFRAAEQRVFVEIGAGSAGLSLMVARKTGSEVMCCTVDSDARRYPHINMNFVNMVAAEFFNSIRGVFHVHITWSCAAFSQAARQRERGVCAASICFVRLELG
jgi:tRNA1(Val) A37 N6-methylase TrmN6